MYRMCVEKEVHQLPGKLARTVTNKQTTTHHTHTNTLLQSAQGTSARFCSKFSWSTTSDNDIYCSLPAGRKSAKVHMQVWGSLKHYRIKGAKAKSAH